jgi:hypothetical protein
MTGVARAVAVRFAVRSPDGVDLLAEQVGRPAAGHEPDGDEQPQERPHGWRPGPWGKADETPRRPAG